MRPAIEPFKMALTWPTTWFWTAHVPSFNFGRFSHVSSINHNLVHTRFNAKRLLRPICDPTFTDGKVSQLDDIEHTIFRFLHISLLICMLTRGDKVKIKLSILNLVGNRPNECIICRWWTGICSGNPRVCLVRVYILCVAATRTLLDACKK